MPDDPQPVFLRTVALLETGALAEAELALATLVLRHSAHSAAWSVLGQARRRSGDAAGAVQALERALAPGLADAWFDLGLACQDLGDIAGAATAFARVVDLAPHRAEAWVNPGVVGQEATKLEAAMAAYTRACRLDTTTFAPIARALTSKPHGRMWVSLSQLARDFEAARLSGTAENACDRLPAPP